MKNTVFVTGIRKIDKKLRGLEMKVQKKVLNRAIRDGLRVIYDETKNQVPKDTHLTENSVKTRAIKKKNRKSVGLQVIISGKVPGLIKYSKAGKRAFYPAIVEYGRKGVPPNPFMRRAFDSTKKQARKITIQAIKDGINRILKSG